MTVAKCFFCESVGRANDMDGYVLDKDGKPIGFFCSNCKDKKKGEGTTKPMDSFDGGMFMLIGAVLAFLMTWFWLALWSISFRQAPRCVACIVGCGT